MTQRKEGEDILEGQISAQRRSEKSARESQKELKEMIETLAHNIQFFFSNTETWMLHVHRGGTVLGNCSPHSEREADWQTLVIPPTHPSAKRKKSP